MSFAAFVITFERPGILANTIAAIFRQTKPPEKLLIVDNSALDSTQYLVVELSKVEPRISYYRVGYNSGPAGGAYYGLKILAEQGYQHIQWCDDDNPPLYDDVTETLFKLFEVDNNVGVVGQAGAKFSMLTGRLVRYSDSELMATSTLEVDYMGGNQLMIVKADLILNGCLPANDLFFGFEDLSFCLKVKSKGYKMLISSKFLLKVRKDINRMGHVKLTSKSTWRDYYSVRSLVYICLYEQHIILPLFFIFIKIVVALPLRKELRFLPLKGFCDGLVGKKGIVILPLSKAASEKDSSSFSPNLNHK